MKKVQMQKLPSEYKEIGIVPKPECVAHLNLYTPVSGVINVPPSIKCSKHQYCCNKTTEKCYLKNIEKGV